MLGTEVAVVAGTPVGLFIALEVCARPGADPGELRAEILALLRPDRDDRPGLFHPSRLTLGSAVYLSAVRGRRRRAARASTPSSRAARPGGSASPRGRCTR